MNSTNPSINIKNNTTTPTTTTPTTNLLPEHFGNFTFKYSNTKNKLNNNSEVEFKNDKLKLSLNRPNQDLGFELKENMGFLIIDGVKDNSIVSRIEGDIIGRRITRVNNNPITTIDEFDEEIKDKKQLELEIKLIDISHKEYIYNTNLPLPLTILDLFLLKNTNMIIVKMKYILKILKKLY